MAIRTAFQRAALLCPSVALLMSLALSGCVTGTPQMFIKSPADTSTVPCDPVSPNNCKVDLNVTWQGAIFGAGPSVTLDNVSLGDFPNGTGPMLVSPGAHVLKASGTVLANWATWDIGATSNFTVGPPPPPQLSFTPGTVTLNAGATATVSVNRGGPTTSPLTVTLTPGNAGLALGTQAAGASDTISIPARQSSVTEKVTGNTAGTTTVTATASGYQNGSLTASVDPVLNVIVPTPASSGTTVTLSGNGFVQGAVAIFRASTAGTGGQRAQTAFVSQYALTAVVPQGVTVHNNVLVQANARISNTVPFTVPRQAGNFVEFSNDVVSNELTPQTCSTGAVKLQISVSSGIGKATFTNAVTGASIGNPISFHPDSLNLNGYVYTGIGGAGFSACNVGIVLDAQNSEMEFRLVDLTIGSPLQASPYAFNIDGGTAPNPFTYYPRLFRSPDNTIILLVTASPQIQQPGTALTASFIDAATGGGIIGKIQIAQFSAAAVAAQVTANGDQVVFTLGQTTYPPINIP